MKGPYLKNIGNKNHVLEKANFFKLLNFLLNSILNFDLLAKKPVLKRLSTIFIEKKSFLLFI